MPISPEEFTKVKGHYLSLEPLTGDGLGNITAIAVTIQGIVGCERHSRRDQPMSYRLLTHVDKLQSGLPTVWVVSPLDSEIEHVNIYHPRVVCPFVGSKLPHICWGTSESAWKTAEQKERTLTNFLNITQQLLAQANTSSRAR